MRGEPADALPPPDGSWFAGLFGFAETDYATVQRGLVVDGPTLTSRANGRRFRIGAFTTPSLGELRARAARVSGAALERKWTSGRSPSASRIAAAAFGSCVHTFMIAAIVYSATPALGESLLLSRIPAERIF